jgi:hypothetical protein
VELAELRREFEENRAAKNAEQQLTECKEQLHTKTAALVQASAKVDHLLDLMKDHSQLSVKVSEIDQIVYDITMKYEEEARRSARLEAELEALRVSSKKDLATWQKERQTLTETIAAERTRAQTRIKGEDDNNLLKHSRADTHQR